MTKPLDDLTTQFIAMLQDHLAGGGETTLLRAYDLGRRAMAEHHNALELLAIQQDALVAVLLRHLRDDESTRIMHAASEVFTESLAPFELNRGSSREGNVLLRHMNVELERQLTARTTELVETNQTLRHEIAQRHRVELELRVSEDRFRNAFDHAPIGIGLLAPDGQWVEVNHALCAMLGYSEEALLQTRFQTSTHPDDVAADQTNVQRLLSGEVTSYQREKRYLHSQGHLVWVQISVSLMRDAALQPQYLIAQIQDITARRETEAALRASQELFQTFMDNSPAVAYIKDETGRYLYANRPLIEHFRYATGHTEWQGKTDFALWSATRAEALRRNDEAAMQAEGTLVVEEITVDDKGEHTWLSFKFPLQMDAGRRLLAGVSVDITERKRMEAWVEHLISATQDAVIAIDREGRIVRFNPAAERIFGYSRAEVQGQKVNLLMPEPKVHGHDSSIACYEQTGQPRVLGQLRTETARRETGEVFPIEISLVEVTVDPDVRYAAFIRDISERVRLQERLVERERLAAIGTTAASLAHEIGNPLNGMSIATQLLERRLGKLTEDESIQMSVRALRNQTNRLANLLAEFRSLARQQKVTLRPTPLAEVIGEVLSSERGLYTERGVTVEQVVAADLPIVSLDPDKFKQVLLNLCKNAVEAMPHGGTLTIRAYVSDAHVFLEIADTGTGIPDGINIFEPFVTTKAEGTGLGLPIVRQIVAAHGGTLRYRSAPGQGTTFIIALPSP